MAGQCTGRMHRPDALAEQSRSAPDALRSQCASYDCRRIQAGVDQVAQRSDQRSTRRSPAKAANAGGAAAASSGPALWVSVGARVRDRERKRDAVVLTAARAFRQRGYHNTSLDDIARELNVTKPTVYHYVENKEQLLFECFRAGLAQIMAGFEEVEGSSATARERLSLVITRYAEAITSDFGWCMVQAENQDLSPAM